MSPYLFVPVRKSGWDGRVYRCQCCGWETPWVQNGKELREATKDHVSR